MRGGTHSFWMKVTHLFADVLPLAVEFIQQFLDVDGKRRFSLFLQVQAHFIDAVDAGLDGVDVIHQSLANQSAGWRLNRWNYDWTSHRVDRFGSDEKSLVFFDFHFFFTRRHEKAVCLLIPSSSVRDILWTLSRLFYDFSGAFLSWEHFIFIYYCINLLSADPLIDDLLFH